MAKVSIMMNCFNSDKYLKEAIDSVLEQTFRDWELIFWDNQSTDSSAEIVKSYSDDRIKYYYAPSHTSLYQGRNSALKYCESEYLAFLDCDDLWLPSKLEKQVEILYKNKDIVLVHSNTIYFNSDNNTKRVANKKSLPHGNIFSKVIKKYRFSLETVIVRKDIIDKYNINFGYKYNMIGDRDFFTIISYYGKVYYIDEILGKWRIHENNFSKILHKTYPMELRFMYLRFKKRFTKDFTKEMRLNIYKELVIRDALNMFEYSSSKVRAKLNKITFFDKRSMVIRIISYLPKNYALKILEIIRRV